MFGFSSYGQSTFAGTIGDISLKKVLIVHEVAYNVANLFEHTIEAQYHVFTEFDTTITSDYIVYGYYLNLLKVGYQVRETVEYTQELGYNVFNDLEIIKEISWDVDPRAFPYIYNNKTKDTPDKELDYLLKDSIKVSDNDKVEIESNKPVKARRKGTVKL